MHASASAAPPVALVGWQNAACGRGGSPAAVYAAGGLTARSSADSPRLAAAIRGRCRASAGLRRAEAFAQSYTGPYPHGSDDGTYERVLRYPTGEERRIRYPLPPAERAASEDLTDGCWGDTCWVPREQWSNWGGSSGGVALAPSPTLAARGAVAPSTFLPQQPPPAEPERQQLPSSPMELLRYLTSPQYKQAQAEQWQRVRGSYEVLEGCPWLLPKPLYLLAAPQPPAAAASRSGEPAPGLTYSLRTRVAQADAEDELSWVLGRRAADGSPLIRCSEMRDGVVAFEDEADAERYGQMLEAEGAAEVSIVRCDSHELFRSVQDVRGVVVLLRAGGDLLPQPHQLATSLRSQAEDAAGGQPLLD